MRRNAFIRAGIVVFLLLAACSQSGDSEGEGQAGGKADTGGCEPVCSAVGTRSEGWYNGCTDELIGYAQCSGCTAECRSVGSMSEGWYSSGSDPKCATAGQVGGDLIDWDKCGSSQ